MNRQRAKTLTKPAHNHDLSVIVSSCKKNMSGYNPARRTDSWPVISKKCNYYPKHAKKTLVNERGLMFTRWSSFIFQKDADGTVQRALTLISLERLLTEFKAEVHGSFDKLTYSEIAFIKFAIVNFSNLLGTYVVNDFGYNDIWLVFKNIDGDGIIGQIEDCRKTINQNHLKGVNYMVLSTDNFVTDVNNPVLHISFGGKIVRH